MNVYVNNRINSIVSSLENRVSTYSSLSVDYAVEAIKADQNKLYFRASYLPKTISHETRAVFYLWCFRLEEGFKFSSLYMNQVVCFNKNKIYMFLKAYCNFTDDDITGLPEKSQTDIITLLSRRMFDDEQKN